MPSLSVFITVWKRQYLEEQMEHILKQSVLPEKIWILQNEQHLNLTDIVEKFRFRFQNIYIIHSEENLKFFGRFSLAVHINTDYVLIIDDDVLPGRDWLMTCLELSLKKNCIISCSGRIIQLGSFTPEKIPQYLVKDYFIGDCFNLEKANFCPRDTIVDYGCNSYFLKTDWLRYFWSIWPYSFLSGEDIHLSSSCKISADIPTFVPKQTSLETCGNLNKYYSRDALSTWRNSDFLDIRSKVIRYMIQEKKWVPIQW